MKFKKKNKGFSLVELIVVMAIMAILAITLAPALIKYVEKSRKAADREVVNAIYTTVQYALLDETIRKDAEVAALNLATGLDLNSTADEAAATEVYKVNGGTWKVNNIKPGSGTDTSYTYKDNLFIQEIYNVVGDFKLKSNEAKSAAKIVIKATESNNVIVTLDYDGTGSTPDFTASYEEVK